MVRRTSLTATQHCFTLETVFYPTSSQLMLERLHTMMKSCSPQFWTSLKGCLLLLLLIYFAVGCVCLWQAYVIQPLQMEIYIPVSANLPRSLQSTQLHPHMHVCMPIWQCFALTPCNTIHPQQSVTQNRENEHDQDRKGNRAQQLHMSQYIQMLFQP